MLSYANAGNTSSVLVLKKGSDRWEVGGNSSDGVAVVLNVL